VTSDPDSGVVILAARRIFDVVADIERTIDARAQLFVEMAAVIDPATDPRDVERARSGLPRGTSELNDIADPLSMSVHRLKRSVSVASSNFSTRITSGWFSMPRLPGRALRFRPHRQRAREKRATVRISPRVRERTNIEVPFFPLQMRVQAICQ